MRGDDAFPRVFRCECRGVEEWKLKAFLQKFSSQIPEKWQRQRCAGGNSSKEAPCCSLDNRSVVCKFERRFPGGSARSRHSRAILVHWAVAPRGNLALFFVSCQWGHLLMCSLISQVAHSLSLSFLISTEINPEFSARICEATLGIPPDQMSEGRRGVSNCWSTFPDNHAVERKIALPRADRTYADSLNSSYFYPETYKKNEPCRGCVPDMETGKKIWKDFQRALAAVFYIFFCSRIEGFWIAPMCKCNTREALHRWGWKNQLWKQSCCFRHNAPSNLVKATVKTVRTT